MPKKLLLADNSITIQKVVEFSLSTEGFNVTSARDGDTAMKLADEIRPDIILADIFLPQINGYELCKRIRASAELKDIPIILLVGKPDSFDMNKANLSGASDFINKPFESSELIDKIISYTGNNSENNYEVIEIPEEEATPVKEEAPSPIAQKEEEIKEEIELVSFENLDKARELEDEIIPKTATIEPKEENVDKNIPFYDITELGETIESKPSVRAPSKEEIESAIKGMVSADDLKRELSAILEENVKGLMRTMPSNQVKEQMATAVQRYVKETASGISKDEIMAEMNRVLNYAVRERIGGIPTSEIKEEQLRIIRESTKDAVKSISPDTFIKELKKNIEEQGKKIIEDIGSSESIKEIVRENIQKAFSGDIKDRINLFIEQEIKRLASGISMEEINKRIEKATANIFEERIEGLLLNISRDMAEKITWEVVPSLAEVIINKEIEKIKAED
ncbi:MAG: response regulator [Nitrospirae bacterium]|nr:response regulator [Nitrospirota bacterium]